MELRILGPVEAVGADGNSLPLGGARQRAVLVLLALDAGRVVSRSALVDGLWQDNPPARAVNTIQVYVSQLRKSLGPRAIRTTSSGYVLEAGEVQLDRNEFCALLAQGSRQLELGNPPDATQVLHAATHLWRGLPLSDLEEYPFAQAEASRLTELRLTAIEQRIQADLALGRHVELIGELETLVKQHPLRERLWAHLMLALYRSERQAEALAAYQRARGKLVDELGIEPSVALRELETEILAQDQKLQPPPAPKVIPWHNLPANLTSFVGRQHELADLNRLMETARLLTLTGAGGVGKTRLALELAATVAENYRDGAWLVELAPLSDQRLVAQHIASTLGLRDQAGLPFQETVTDFLRSRQPLLILDNCEHVLAGVAQVAHALLRACPTLRILATSRQQLGVPGEHAWRVPSLSIPPGDSSLAPAEAVHIDSVHLFIQRASLANQDFRLTERNLRPIIEITRRLDGIPLAIELAAARVKVLSPLEIQERLDDRFRFLSVSGPATIPRQRTLRALVDWSYDLLTGPERTLLYRLSAFTGTFTLKAAEEICPESPVDSGSVLDVLYQLVDKSLVIAFPSEPSTRYGMLETIRQYAKDRLIESGEQGQVEKRYRHWYAELAKRAEPALEGADQVDWLESLEAELDNIRESLRLCQEADDISSCLELAAGIWRFWWIRGHLREGRAWLDSSLAQRNLDLEVRAKALHAAGALAWDQTDFPAARRFLAESVKEFSAIGDLRGSALSKVKLGSVLSLQGRYEQARRLLQNSLATGRQVEDRQVIAQSIIQLGQLAMFEWNLSVARSLLNESLLAFQSVHDTYGITASLGALGEIALHEGDHHTAQALLDESHRLGQAMGDKWRIARAQTMLGELARREGDIGRAASLHKGALRLRSQIGLQDGIAQSIEAIARLLNDASQSVRAAHLYGAADALRAWVGLPVDLGMHDDHMTQMDVVQQLLDAEAFRRAWDEGRAMPFQDAVRIAMDCCDDLG